MPHRLQRLTALVFVVLWMPITAHCDLEKLPGLEFLGCSSETAESSGCEGDGCQTVESGFYKISDDSGTIPLPDFYVILYLTPPAAECVQPLFGALHRPSSAPLEVPQRWQFISRAALPIRAPSLVS